jgi:phenylacetic acid degradation operon negative regulatory protein
VSIVTQSRLNQFREQRRVQAGSLIITFFGDVVLPRGGKIWLGSLIRLLEPLELNERLIRTSVFRLVKEEWLRTETIGRRADYVLTPSGRRRFEEASRHIYASHAPLWDRRWRLILVTGELDSTVLEDVRRALFWQGFGSLGAACFVHPSAELSTALDVLVTAGLSSALKALLPLFAADACSALSASDIDLVRRAWDLGNLAEAYSAFVSTYQPILDELRLEHHAGVSDQDAFLLRILLIHDYRRLLLRDPELPDVLLPPEWPGRRAQLLCKELYKRLETPSNRHLDQQICIADGSTPAVDTTLAERFVQSDPLAA